MTRLWSRGGFAALLVLLATATLAHAQNPMSEYAVKAAYLFDFGKFVRYTPSQAAAHERTTFDICVVGEDPFGRTLDELTSNEKLDNKPVRVLRLKSAAEARGCSIAYFSASEGSRLAHDVESLRGQEVLTVSDAPNFIRDGGMIQFVISRDHVRFAVNLGAARKDQLNLSSELLKVAISVEDSRSSEVRR